MKTFLAGFGIGVAVGMLFAPRSGEEMRNTLVETAGDWADSARQTFEKGQEKVRGVWDKGQEVVRSGMNAVRGDSESRATGTENRIP
jgi:gas vesicle protein